MSLCAQCISGVRHEGVPEGQIQTIGGVEVYVATPTIEYPKDKAILFFTDVFGVPLPNSRLLADDYARNGFKVYVPNYFGNDALPPDALNPGSDYDFMGWLAKHPTDEKLPIIRSLIAALKAEGITKFGALGFCYGARLAFDLAFTGEVHVVAVSHPSLLKIPEDLEKYAQVSKAPLLINSCETDQMFPPPAQAQADEILGGGKFAPGYQRTYWDGCTHGFTVRGDLSNPKVKAGKEGAFKATVEHLISKL